MVEQEFKRPIVIRPEDLEDFEIETVGDEFGRAVLRVTLPIDHPVARSLRDGRPLDGLSIRFPGEPAWSGRVTEIVPVTREAVDGPPRPDIGELAHRAHLEAFERMLAAEYGIDRREVRP